MKLRLQFLSIILMCACGSSEPTQRPAMPPQDPPPPAIAVECTVRADIEPTLEQDRLRLRFVLSNTGSEAATITLRGRCPGGVVEVGGLPTTFDPMHRCQAGECQQPTTTETFTIAAHDRITIGETTLEAKGDACNPPLPSGPMFLQAIVTTEPHVNQVCSGEPVRVVRDSHTERSRPPKPAKPTPTVAPRKNCPVCGFACPNGIPSTKRGPDGCPTCSCEPFDLTRGTTP